MVNIYKTGRIEVDWFYLTNYLFDLLYMYMDIMTGSLVYFLLYIQLLMWSFLATIPVIAMHFHTSIIDVYS